MPGGVKYTEPDELDSLQKAELILQLNPPSFEDRMIVYAKVIRILQHFGYRRSNLTGVQMIKDDEPNVIFFKTKFSIGSLSDIPNHIQFAIYVALSQNLNPDIPTTHEFRKQIEDILKQTSVKVKRRIHKNLIKFLRWCGYKLDSKVHLIHEFYPPIRNGVLQLEYIPYHLQMALWGYFVMPKLRGQRMRIGVINLKKKNKAFQKKLQRMAEEIEKQKAAQIQKRIQLEADINNLDKQISEYDKSGF